jgi:hypothetical protein
MGIINTHYANGLNFMFIDKNRKKLLYKQILHALAQSIKIQAAAIRTTFTKNRNIAERFQPSSKILLILAQ